MPNIAKIDHLGSYRIEVDGLQHLVRIGVAHHLLALGRDMPKGMDPDHFMATLIKSFEVKQDRDLAHGFTDTRVTRYRPAIPESRLEDTLTDVTMTKKTSLKRVAIIRDDDTAVRKIKSGKGKKK